jgi:chromosome segregation ATPase
VSGESDSLTGWVLAGIGGIMSTLLTGLVTLFRMRENENTKAIAELKEKATVLEERSEKCESDRAELSSSCAVLKTKMEFLEQRIAKIDSDGTKFSRETK